jgi:hypothetical protein
MKNEEPTFGSGRMRLTGFGLVVVTLVVLAVAARLGGTRAGTGMATGPTTVATSQGMGQ